MDNMASHLISEARKCSGISLREMARRAGTSHATLHAYIRGAKSPSTTTLNRIIAACDLALDFKLRRRVRGRHGLARGEELAQVLRLAEQFPASPTREPRYPKFPQRP